MPHLWVVVIVVQQPGQATQTGKRVTKAGEVTMTTTIEPLTTTLRKMGSLNGIGLLISKREELPKMRAALTC